MNLVYETKLGKLYHGDMTDMIFYLEPQSVDLVFTDPPYPKKYEGYFQSLAVDAPVLMKDGASLFTLCGHYQLEFVIQTFANFLKFRWILDLDQENDSHARMAMGIEVCWKPLLWYVKNRFPKDRHYGFLKDKLISNAKEKDLHEWQQSISWVMYLMEKVTKPGELVLDPFCGSGTFLEAAERLGRRWIGIDIDKNAIDTTIERLSHVN